jgi:predicted metal-dependent hydrolase
MAAAERGPRPARRAPSLAATETVRLVELSQGTLKYTLRRSSKAQQLRVLVDPDRGVVVTVPSRGGVRLVDGFLAEREDWLRRHLTDHARQRRRLAAMRPYGPNWRIIFLGELHRVRIEPAEQGIRRSRVFRVGADDGDELLVRMARSDRRPPARVLELWLRERAEATIRRQIQGHAEAMGVTPVAISIRDQRTRWGSATKTGRLAFSWRLILAPPQALETVVIHELAHLRVFGHGPRFWALVASRRSDHVAWRRWLREHSLELHVTLDVDDGRGLGGVRPVA